MLNNIKKDIGSTCIGDKNRARKKFFTDVIFNTSARIEVEIQYEPDDLQDHGKKFVILSDSTDIYTRLEVLLGLKLAEHTDTLTDLSNLIDKVYKRGELQNEQQHRNALDKFYTV